MENSKKTMDKIVALCKNRGFIFPGSEIMDINRETIISEILTNFPEAMPKFQELGMHCLGCALATAESLEQACAAHGVDPDEFIVELKAYLLAL